MIFNREKNRKNYPEGRYYVGIPKLSGGKKFYPIRREIFEYDYYIEEWIDVGGDVDYYEDKEEAHKYVNEKNKAIEDVFSRDI